LNGGSRRACSQPSHFSRPQVLGAVRRSFLVELDASVLFLLRPPIETDWLRFGENEPKFQCRSSPLP
jgi:hypothetical protein